MPANQTQSFLAAGGSPAQVTLSSIHGLWGGHEIGVSAGGAIRVRPVDRARHETLLEVDDPPAAAAVFAALVAHDFVALARAPVDRPPALAPDTAITTVTLTNGAGQAERLWFGEHDRLAPGLAAIRDALLDLRRLARP